MMDEQNSRARTAMGRARVDGRTMSLVSRIEAGEIAVIDQIDLDRQAAHALASRSPIAVLNAAPSTSGRQSALGPKILLDAGIIVIDDLGQDVMAVREGQTVEIIGEEVHLDGRVLATGHRLSTDDLERDELEQRRIISQQIGSFAASIDEYLELDGAVLRGEGVPACPELSGRPALLVLDDARAGEDLRALKKWIGDAAPVIIGVDTGADLARSAGLPPSIVVGDMDRIGEAVLRAAGRRVLRRGHDGLVAGKDRLDRMGLHSDLVEMSGTSEDVAVLLAHHAGATSIVVAGGSHDLDDFVDRGRSAMAPSFFTRLAAGDSLVSARAVAAAHTPRISGAWIGLLLLVLLVVTGAALWSTPWGRDLVSLILPGTLASAAGADPAVLLV